MSPINDYEKILALLSKNKHQKAINVLLADLPKDTSGTVEVVSISGRFTRHLNSEVNYDKDPEGLSRELNRITAAIIHIAEKYYLPEQSGTDEKEFEDIYRISSARTAVGKLLVQNSLQGVLMDTTRYQKTSGVPRRLVIRVFDELEVTGHVNKTHQGGKACYVLTDKGKKLLAFLNK
ncbi:MAG: hypothetical protein AB8H12_07195 [Lewinella sp.]